MKLEGAIPIATSSRDVWALVIDPLTLASCVPGVRAVRRVDDRTFEGLITAAVGPMEGDFSFRSVITRAELPELDVTTSGVDSVTRSRLDATIAATVTEDGPFATVLRYQAEIQIKGRLAILGETVLRATATMMISQVARCLQARLAGAAPE
jgi:hypothetical protein